MEKDINLPNLLIVGAAKSGTTSLHNYLNQHPDIFMSRHKEPHFLINSEIGEDRIHKGVTSIDDYKNMFKTQDEYIYKGESSVMYLSFPDFSIKNIRKYLSSSVKIIIMLRNPIDRAFSGYQHNMRYNPMENLNFKEAIMQSEDRYHQNLKITPDTRYLHVGKYYSQVKQFMCEFEDNVHIILYNDYVRDINLCINGVFDFLGVERVLVDSSKRHMQGGWVFKNIFLRNLLIPDNIFKTFVKKMIPIQSLRYRIKNKVMNASVMDTASISEEMKKKLITYYKKDIILLSRLLDRDLNHWYEV